MSSTQQLLQTIDQLQSQGVRKVTVPCSPPRSPVAVSPPSDSHPSGNPNHIIMTYSNLSRIKPKLRTQGNVTGNFGRPKSKAGSQLSDIGNSNKEVINITTRQEYINKMIAVFHKSVDKRMKDFAYSELHRLHAI